MWRSDGMDDNVCAHWNNARIACLSKILFKAVIGFQLEYALFSLAVEIT